MMKRRKTLSPEGRAFLADPALLTALRRVTDPLGVTPEEYLLRFEEILATCPDAIIGLFASAPRIP